MCEAEPEARVRVRAAGWAEPEKAAWTAGWGTAGDCEAQVAPGAEAEASPALADEPEPGASQRAHTRRASGSLVLQLSPAWPPLFLDGPDAPAYRTAPVGPASPASQRAPACRPSPVVLAQSFPHVRPSVAAQVAPAAEPASLAPGLAAPPQAAPGAQARSSPGAPASPSEASPAARIALAVQQILVLVVQPALVVRAASLVQAAPAPVSQDELGAPLVAAVRESPAAPHAAAVRDALVFLLVLVRVAPGGQVFPVDRPSPGARSALVGRRLSPGAPAARSFRSWAP